MKLIGVVFPLILLLDCCLSARILVLFPLGPKSHKNSITPIAEALAERGHEITLVSSFPPTKPVKNIREIVLTELTHSLDGDTIKWFEMTEQGVTQMVTMISYIRTLMRDGYATLMRNPEFLAVLKERNFDLVIFDALFTEFAHAISEYLQVPKIARSAASETPFSFHSMGIPNDYAYVPSVLTDFDDRMTFFQRLVNMLTAESQALVYKYAAIDLVDEMVKKDFPEARTVAEMEKETSLILMNSHPTTAWPRSLPPTIIPLGALHTRPAQPLSSPFDKYAEEAKDGFILFTLGSIIPVSSMPKPLLQMFLKAFARLPLQVIWKWEAQLPDNVPVNVIMTKWLPQQDLLGHPNIKLFISHGGLLGTQEAVYHGVPVLYLPFGNDQKAIATKANREGYALQLDWNNLSEELVYDTINQLIQTPSFKGNATRVSRLMRDELMPGKEVAVYWVEHVLRHGGTKHLQLSGRDMPFYQRYLLDVIAFLLLVGCLALYIEYRLICWLLSKFCRRSSTKRKTQ